MNRQEVETVLHQIAERHVGRAIGQHEAIYQDAGLNGADFYEFMVDVADSLPLPEFDWSEFADMSEPPDGLGFFGGLKILKRKRLTIAHLAYSILHGRWSDPVHE